MTWPGLSGSRGEPRESKFARLQPEPAPVEHSTEKQTCIATVGVAPVPSPSPPFRRIHLSRFYFFLFLFSFLVSHFSFLFSLFSFLFSLPRSIFLSFLVSIFSSLFLFLVTFLFFFLFSL